MYPIEFDAIAPTKLNTALMSCTLIATPTIAMNKNNV